jgi:hypothetical protein
LTSGLTRDIIELGRGGAPYPGGYEPTLSMEEIGMTTSMKELGYWIRKEFATDLGGHCVPTWTVVDADRYREHQIAKYGIDSWVGEDDYSDAESHNEHLLDGATHVVRVITGTPWELCDGVDFYVDLSSEYPILVSEIDSPDYQGGKYDECVAWVTELAEPIDA